MKVLFWHIQEKVHGLTHVYFDYSFFQNIIGENHVQIFQVTQKTWQYNRGSKHGSHGIRLCISLGHVHLYLFWIQKKRKTNIGIQPSGVINLSDARLFILSGCSPFFYIIDSQVTGPGNPRLL